MSSLYASSLVVDACTGWGLEISLLVVGSVAVAYTALGGLVADVFSDVLQFALLWGATLVVTAVLGFGMAGRGLTGFDPARLALSTSDGTASATEHLRLLADADRRLLPLCLLLRLRPDPGAADPGGGRRRPGAKGADGREPGALFRWLPPTAFSV